MEFFSFFGFLKNLHLNVFPLPSFHPQKPTTLSPCSIRVLPFLATHSVLLPYTGVWSLGKTKDLLSHWCPTRPFFASYVAQAIGPSLCTLWMVVWMYSWMGVGGCLVGWYCCEEIKFITCIQLLLWENMPYRIAVQSLWYQILLGYSTYVFCKIQWIDIQVVHLFFCGSTGNWTQVCLMLTKHSATELYLEPVVLLTRVLLVFCCKKLSSVILLADNTESCLLQFHSFTFWLLIFQELKWLPFMSPKNNAHKTTWRKIQSTNIISTAFWRTK